MNRHKKVTLKEVRMSSSEKACVTGSIVFLAIFVLGFLWFAISSSAVRTGEREGRIAAEMEYCRSHGGRAYRIEDQVLCLDRKALWSLER